MARLLMHYIRIWDVRTSAGVDRFVAKSQCVARRIKKVYRRSATVVYPPVDVDRFAIHPKRDSFYVTVCRLVSYKRVDLLLQAFARMPGRELVILGTGPDLAKLRRSAPCNVILRGSVSDIELADYVGRAKAFVYAGEEDFGISMVEAQACGTPVLAFARGGALEIVQNGDTGLLFDRQNPEAIVSSIEEFEQRDSFDPLYIRRSAMRFSTARFRARFRNTVNDAISEHRGNSAPVPEGDDESIADETSTTRSFALD